MRSSNGNAIIWFNLTDSWSWHQNLMDVIFPFINMSNSTPAPLRSPSTTRRWTCPTASWRAAGSASVRRTAPATAGPACTGATACPTPSTSTSVSAKTASKVGPESHDQRDGVVMSVPFGWLQPTDHFHSGAIAGQTQVKLKNANYGLAPFMCQGTGCRSQLVRMSLL